MQESCDGFRIGYWVFQFPHAIGHVGVGVGHAAKAHVMDTRFMGQPDFFDDVLGCPPNGDPLFWFDAKFAPLLVAHATLVDLNFVRQGSWIVLCTEVGMVDHGVAGRTGMGPSGPLFSRPALVFPLTGFEEVMERGVRVLNR